MKSEYLKNLKDAITAMHGCDCVHISSMKVIEDYEAERVWEGDVEIFDLVSHPQATQAFAWAWEEDNEPKYIAVLNISPVNDASDAVRAAIASGQFS